MYSVLKTPSPVWSSFGACVLGLPVLEGSDPRWSPQRDCCLFIYSPVLSSYSCISADPGVILLLLSPDWMSVPGVNFHFLIRQPIRVVCFVLTSECCGCHSISRIILGCLSSLLLLLLCHSHTDTHTDLQACIDADSTPHCKGEEE